MNCHPSLRKGIPLVFLVLVLGGLSGDHGDFAAAIDLTAVTVLNALKAN
jgi:hypothetical protein